MGIKAHIKEIPKDIYFEAKTVPKGNIKWLLLGLSPKLSPKNVLVCKFKSWSIKVKKVHYNYQFCVTDRNLRLSKS